VSKEENKIKVQRYVEEVLNGKNLEAVNDIFASDCVLQDPNLREERQGSEVIAAFARLCHIVSPDYTVYAEEPVAPLAPHIPWYPCSCWRDAVLSLYPTTPPRVAPSLWVWGSVAGCAVECIRLPGGYEARWGEVVRRIRNARTS